MASTLCRIRPVDAGQQLFMVTPIDQGVYPDHGLPGPQPPFPGGGGGGPVDPGYSPPWAQIPVDPGYSPPWAQPGPRPPRPSPGPGVSAVVIQLPAQDPPVPPPEGMAEGSVQVLIWFGPGTQPAMAWVAPFASTGPVAPQPEINPLDK